MSQKLEKFYEYVESYQRLIWSVARRYVDEQTAEDVGQDVLLKMYENLDDLRDQTVKQWLIVVTKNKAKDYLKKGGDVIVNPVDQAELMMYMEASVESAEASFERMENEKAALELYRTACRLLYEKNLNWYYSFVYSRDMDMTSAEIAKILNTTANHVDVMRSRAKNYLRKQLGDEAKDLF